MSKISLKHSGGNVVSLNSPTSAPTSADVAFKLPNADGTSGQAIVTDASGNLSFASTGKILQVKTNTTQGSTGSLHVTPTLTYVDIPDQNVTITPSATSSKILLSFHQMGETASDNHHFVWGVKRAISGGATTVIEAPTSGNRTSALTVMTRSHGTDNDTTIDAAHCTNYIDSPNTTSAVTYTVQIKNGESTNYYYYNRNHSAADTQYRERGLSWITVMEVGA